MKNVHLEIWCNTVCRCVGAYAYCTVFGIMVVLYLVYRVFLVQKVPGDRREIPDLPEELVHLEKLYVHTRIPHCLYSVMGSIVRSVCVYVSCVILSRVLKERKA